MILILLALTINQFHKQELGIYLSFHSPHPTPPSLPIFTNMHHNLPCNNLFAEQQSMLVSSFLPKSLPQELLHLALTPLAKRSIIQILPTHFHAHANLANLNTISRYHKIFPSDAPIVLVTINNHGDCYPRIPASLHRPSSYQTYLTLVMTGIYCRYSCHGSQSLNYITAFHAKTTFYV